MSGCHANAEKLRLYAHLIIDEAVCDSLDGATIDSINAGKQLSPWDAATIQQQVAANGRCQPCA